MLGILLNAFKNLGTTITEATKFVDFGPSFFGIDSSMNYPDYTQDPQIDYPAGQTTFLGSQLAENSGNISLSFNNLTVPEGITIVSDRYTNQGLVSPGVYAPLIIRCKNTLTINGEITATGCGEAGNITTINNYSELNQMSVIAPNFSTPLSIYSKLVTYFGNNPFGNLSTFYFGTGGGNQSVGYGISSGGHNTGIAGGGSGGFILLYFTHLYAYVTSPTGLLVRKEYGVDADFPMERIHANGVGGNCGSNTTFGGGALILAAKNIYLGPNGKITSDGTLHNGVTRTGTNYSFLNNIPQLGKDQTDYHWDPLTESFIVSIPSDRTYYYNNGLKLDACNASIPGNNNSAEFCGGGGVVFGFKVNS